VLAAGPGVGTGVEAGERRARIDEANDEEHGVDDGDPLPNKI